MKKLILMLAVCVILSGCGTTNVPEKVDTSAKVQETKEETKPKEPEYFKVGDTVEIGGYKLTVNSVTANQGSGYSKAKEGEKFVILDATLENTSTESQNISSMMQFELMDSNAYKCDMTFMADKKGDIGGELAVGRKMRGQIAYKVQKDEKNLELFFKPGVFENGQAIYKITLE